MKKLSLLLLLFVGVVSSPETLRTDINKYEDEKIVKTYKDYLLDIDVNDYLPSVSIKDIIDVKEISIDDNVIDYPVFNYGNSISNISISNNFEFNEKDLKGLFKRNLSTDLEKKISESINSSYNNLSIGALYVDGNNDANKVTSFKRELVEFGNSSLKRTGILTVGKFITSDRTSEIYNSVIELDI